MSILIVRRNLKRSETLESLPARAIARDNSRSRTACNLEGKVIPVVVHKAIITYGLQAHRSKPLPLELDRDKQRKLELLIEPLRTKIKLK